MKKVFSKKFLVPIMAMLLCVTVAFGTVVVADSTSGGSNITINVNATDTVKKYEGSTEDAIYLGEGWNEWDMSFGPDAVLKTGMSDAYFEVTAQRILKVKPNMVRFMIQPYYLAYLDDGTYGEKSWTDGKLNFDSPYMYNFWRYLEVFQAAGTAVELNYGYTCPKPMNTWFCIKDVPTSTKQLDTYGYAGTSAPRDLKTFARNLGLLIDECAKRGFIAGTDEYADGKERRLHSTIQYINFYNEVHYGGEYTAFGDKRAYWCRMLQYVHEDLQDRGYRSKDEKAVEDRDLHSILIIGLESSTSGNIAPYQENTRLFIDYLYTNAYQKGYCESFDTHLYINYFGKSGLTRGIDAVKTTAYATERWPMNIKGTYNILIAEHGSSESSANYTGSADGKSDYSGIATPFDGSSISQAIGFSLGGCMATLNWFSHDQYYPRNPNFMNSAFVHFWAWTSYNKVENGSLTGYKDSSGKFMGIEGVNSTFGESIFMRYLPDNASVAKSTVDSTNENYVRLASYMNDTDTAVVAEFDYYGGTADDASTPGFSYSEYKKDRDNGDGKWTYNPRTVRINLGTAAEGAYKAGKKYYKYTYEFVESSFNTSVESQTVYDGNAIMPDGVELEVKYENGNYYIEDTISANHCLVVYSTVEPLQQIALTGTVDKTTTPWTYSDDYCREIVYDLADEDQVNNGVQITVDIDKCTGISQGAKFVFDVYRGVIDPCEGDDIPEYLASADGFNNEDLKKAYLNTNCSEFKNSETYGTTLNKRPGTVTTNEDGVSATYKCDAEAKAGDTIAVRVKLATDSGSSMGTQTKKTNGNVLQIYDTEVYAISVIKIIDSSAK